MNKKEVKMNKTFEELNRTVSKMTVGIKEVENKIDRKEQYSRRNCILIHGTLENKKE